MTKRDFHKYTDDDSSYQGYVPSNEAGRPAPKLAGWSIPEDSTNGQVYTHGYNPQDIVCHVGATAGAVAVQVEAGSTVELVSTMIPSDP